ncbi:MULTISPECIES: metallophosphoesterase [unclassified Helicobacter]|uniref:metallophosphoesterase n=1 Tax=unclassified Helicobacter TaxID=2593540 RepID=UPI000CF181B2|nr:MULTISPECIES: metallophosphoesterase [unclassified Helicobacter]
MQNQSVWLFYFCFFCITCLLHGLVYFTFFYRVGITRPKYEFYFIALLLTLNLSYIFLHNSFDFPYGINLILSFSLGISFLLIVGAIFYYLSILPLLLFGTKEQYYSFLPIARISCLSLAILGMIYGSYNGFFKQPKLQKVTLDIPLLSKELKIVQISDLHINTFVKIQSIQKVIDIANATNPDIIVLTGDIVDARSDFVGEKINLLKGLRSKFGTYYVLGNHEYFHDTKEILEKLKENNIIILNNTSSTISYENKALINIIGITDFFGNNAGFLQPDIQQAILKATPNIPSVLLSHQPKVIEYLKNTKINLVLSGHTHGGQIFPFNLLVPLQQPYVKGLYEFKPQEYIYISQGSGFWGPPMRIGTNSEITLIKLVPQQNIK